jgi:pantothenate kinase
MIKINFSRSEDGITLSVGISFSIDYMKFMEILEDLKNNYLDKESVKMYDSVWMNAKSFIPETKLGILGVYLFAMTSMANMLIEYIGDVKLFGDIEAEDLKNILKDRFLEFFGDVVERDVLLLILTLMALTKYEIKLDGLMNITA